MNFPVMIPLGPIELHPHPVFELLASMVGFRLFLARRARTGDALSLEIRLIILLGAIVGALVGAKLLHHLANPTAFIENWRDPLHWLQGRTIVGALIGGWLCTEAVKRKLEVTQSTGDLYVIPLCVAIAIGRIGCFLSGLHDGTHGIATDLWLGVDLGDGISRHPVQLYEILFLIAFAFDASRRQGDLADGQLFRSFLVAYCAFRFMTDFLKPYETILGLQGIQWACLLTILHHVVRHLRGQTSPETTS